MWTWLEVVLWGDSQSSFVRILAVQFSSVRIPTQFRSVTPTQISNGRIQPKPPVLRWIGMSQQKWPEPARMPGPLCGVSPSLLPLLPLLLSEDERPIKSCTAGYARGSLSFESHFYSLQTLCVLPRVLPHQNITWVYLSKIPCESVSHDTTRNFNLVQNLKDMQ